MMGMGSPLVLLDVRTREEHEAVSIPGSRLMTQDVIQEAFSSWDSHSALVLYDHSGTKVLDSVAYFVGHGFVNAKGLQGGIDAYSREVDPKLPRYRVEVD
jgi:rhodanese-related sulfurtransferase